MSRLVVVSNRVALPDDEASAGGLATALHSALADQGGLWFGWSGEVTAETGDVHVCRDGHVSYRTVDLGKRDYADYYNGFANRALWPLFHYRSDLVDYQRANYEGYARINQLFADRLAALIKPDDTIWVHDYHLIPLAERLREHGIKNRIGFFLHTPLPAAQLLVTLPHHQRLLGSFAAYDLIGVQTDNDLHALQDYFVHEAGAQLHGTSTIETSAGRRFDAATFPISIDTASVAAAARKAATSEATMRLKESLDGRALVIGVDRLDYSKGIPERFDAFAQLLHNVKALRNRVCLLQVAPPSRSAVPEYRQIRRELERRAGHINGAWAEPDWVPIRYVNQTIAQDELAGYYRSADVGLVTPLRDGMNLVAKEYVASQDPSDPGVLVLSRFAGAAQELVDALLVNPGDHIGVAEALQRALSMPLDERRKRWRAMMDVLERNTIDDWRRAFLSVLGNAR